MKILLLTIFIIFLTVEAIISQSNENHCNTVFFNLNRIQTESFSRPTLTGPVQKKTSDKFVVHYTLEGHDATTAQYADSVLKYAEISWNVQVVQLNWNQPPSDSGRGGDDRYDI